MNANQVRVKTEELASSCVKMSHASLVVNVQLNLLEKFVNIPYFVVHINTPVFQVRSNIPLLRPKRWLISSEEKVANPNKSVRMPPRPSLWSYIIDTTFQ